MYYLVNVDHNSMAVHLTRSDCEGLKKCCISSAVDMTDGGMLWDGSECEEGTRTYCEHGDSDTDW